MKIYGITVLVLASVLLIFGTISKLFSHSSGNSLLIGGGVLILGGAVMLGVAKLKKA